jgi:uncharacterized protein YfaP (DUF2135 family)
MSFRGDTVTTSQISLPNPRTWVTDDLVTVPRLRGDVDDAVAFFLQRPAFIGQNNGATNIANATNTDLGLNVQLTDPWNGWVPNPGGFSAQYWAPVPGWYLCRSAVAFASGAPIAAGFGGTTGGTAIPTQNGALVANGTAQPLTAQGCDLIEQTLSGTAGGSGDFIKPTCFQNSGGALALASGTGTSAPMPCVTVRWVCSTTGTQPLPVPPLTSVPSPITSTWLNADVRDTIRYLLYPPILKAVYTPGSATLPSSTLAAASTVPYGTITVDNYAGYNTSTFTYTAPVAGRYFAYGHFNLAAGSAANFIACGLNVNGTVAWGDIATYPSGITGGASVTRRIRLNAGDTVKIAAAQGTGSTLAYSTVNQSRMVMCWEGI